MPFFPVSQYVLKYYETEKEKNDGDDGNNYNDAAAADDDNITITIYSTFCTRFYFI